MLGLIYFVIVIVVVGLVSIGINTATNNSPKTICGLSHKQFNAFCEQYNTLQDYIDAENYTRTRLIARDLMNTTDNILLQNAIKPYLMEADIHLEIDTTDRAKRIAAYALDYKRIFGDDSSK